MAAEVGERSAVAIAMAFAGRTARACHVCATRSALWYCAADEAYLCTACDTQVHSANALSLRHERVRLAPNGTVPRKRSLQHSSSLVPDEARKTSRPYSQHLRKLTRLSNQLVDSNLDPDSESSHELELNFADELLCDGNQEVPSVSPAASSSDAEFQSQDGDHAATLAAFFKGKAAHSEHDQFLVPDTAFGDLPGVDTTNIDFAGDAFFFPGDIPGLDSFTPDLRDDFAMSFDLALSHNNRLDAFEGTPDVTLSGSTSEPAELSDAGPFAIFFATKRRDGGEEPMGAERIKREARAMLECCDDGAGLPALQLDLTGVLAAWSGRGEPWMVDSSDSNSSGSDSAALVPDMDGDRDARVMRYKQKRRTRLFSKKIRYEVRKLNAERRPRMKGRFVKRTS
jgi:hypothetical protein